MPIRIRLAFLYTLVLALILLFYSSWFTNSTRYHLMQETDEELASWAEVTADRVVERNFETAGVKLFPEADIFRFPGIHIQLLSNDGALLYCSASLGERHLPFNGGAVMDARAGQASYYTGDDNGRRVRVYNLPIMDKGGRVRQVLQVGKSMVHIEQTRHVMTRLAYAGSLIAVVIAGVLSYLMAFRALRPVASMTETAHDIAAAGRFTGRIPETSANDELGRLAKAFNLMLGSLDSIFRSQKRFVADASHELRSPLTSLGNNISFLKRSDDGREPARLEALSEMESDMERMGRLVGRMLNLARAEGKVSGTFGIVDLSGIVRGEFASFKAMAGTRDFTADIRPGVMVWGDADGIRQAVGVLIENAIRYTRANGRVSVTVSKGQGAMASISVEDDGIGIPESERELVFERFHRSNEAKVMDPGGVGLGLSLVRSVADMHGGTVGLASVPGKGSRFELLIPITTAE